VNINTTIVTESILLLFLMYFYLVKSLSFVNIHTGRALIISNGVDYCLRVLKVLLEYWKSNANKEVLFIMSAKYTLHFK